MASDFARGFMNYVWEEIKHGDAEHKAWLQKKCQDLIPALDKRLKNLKMDQGTETVIKMALVSDETTVLTPTSKKHSVARVCGAMDDGATCGLPLRHKGYHEDSGYIWCKKPNER